MLVQGALCLSTPETPEVVVFAAILFAGIGFGAVDLMPWAMLGEVIDEDELETGERREGIYNGLFMFLRKLAGALAVFLVLGLLDLLGFTQGANQPEVVRKAILILSSLAPAALLAGSVWIARGYPLTRREHARILVGLSREREAH